MWNSFFCATLKYDMDELHSVEELLLRHPETRTKMSKTVLRKQGLNDESEKTD